MWSINIVTAIAILCFAVVNASVGSGNRDLYRVTELEQYGSKGIYQLIDCKHLSISSNLSVIF